MDYEFDLDEILALEEHLEYGHLEKGMFITKGSINRDDRVNRINPQLSCSFCPPNRGENYNHSNYREHQRQVPKKKCVNDRKNSRILKARQHKPDEPFSLLMS